VKWHAISKTQASLTLTQRATASQVCALIHGS